MSDHFIPLNCNNCGAKLDVYDDMERFSCGFCGSELIVQRRGGTITLEGIAETIEKVKVGTDKTAAELALVRLNDELQKLSDEAGALRSGSERSKGCSVLFAIPLCILAIFFLGSGSNTLIFLGIVMSGLCILWITTAWGSPSSERLADLDQKISVTKDRITEQRKIVDS